jgi:DNA-3-methyladenine glycosylase II
MAPLVEEFRGLKPLRFPSVFETVVNRMACQQLSLLVGTLLLSRLAHKYGRALGLRTTRRQRDESAAALADATNSKQ